MQGRAGEAAFFDSELIIKRILINLLLSIFTKNQIFLVEFTSLTISSLV
jgi:hypothetical protein